MIRIFEWLQWLALGVLALGLFSGLEVGSVGKLVKVFFVLGMPVEGFKFAQLVAVIGFIVYLATGKPLCLYSGLGLGALCIYRFGNSDFSKFKPRGPHGVGCFIRQLQQERVKIDVSVFYPCKQTAKGTSVPFYPYRQKQIEGACIAAPIFPGTFLFKWVGVRQIIKPFVDLQVPVSQTEGRPCLPKLDLIVFSHGLTVNRMGYSAACKELASLGHLVVSLTHNDGSADYSPYCGQFNASEPMHSLPLREQQLSQRVDEVKTVVSLIQKQGLKALHHAWFDIEVGQVTLMGHSFGALTSIKAAVNLGDRVQKIVALDPWMFASQREVQKLCVKQPCFITLTEFWNAELASLESSFRENTKLVETLVKQGEKAECHLMEDQGHLNVTDYILLAPVIVHLAAFTKMPPADLLNRYLKHVWLAHNFLSPSNKLTLN